MASRLADRLKAARHHYFVGREAELALFKTALAAPELPFNILLVFGPGGIGKTSLLYEFAYLCEQAGALAAYLDAHNLEPAPEAFEEVLRRAIQAQSTASLADTLAAQDRPLVLLIDTYERLAPLDAWLRQTFLPQLPANVLTVLAGRQQPSLAWLADPGWQTLMRTLPLRNLSPEEGQTYLRKHKIPPEQQGAILNFTYGHPLALSLVVDIFAQRPETSSHLQFETTPGVVNMLLKRLVQKVPGPAHRAALEACALVHVTTEALLAEMLGVAEAHELFDWLQQLSFIETGPAGLFPHDLVRDALTADLRWRNPDWFAELHRRARTFYTQHLYQTAGPAQQRLILDYIFLHRDNPMVRPFFEWQTTGGVLPDAIRQADISALTALVAQYEGADSARLAAYWFARQPENILILRDPNQQPVGLLTLLALQQTTPEDLQADPAIAAGWRYLQNHGPLQPGEKATFFRFWLAHDTYQAVSPTQSLIFINIVRHYLTTPRLAFTFFPCADPEFWAPMCVYADLIRLVEVDFAVGGRRYGVYGHDWRASPPLAWLAVLADREVAVTLQTPPALSEPPVLILSQPDFERAVQEALRELRYAPANGLYANPLLRSRLVLQRAGLEAGEAERAAALQRLLRETADSLQTSPREARYYRALYHTYFQPAPTQEQAAELLNLPFSTFRRHLKTGVAHLTQLLWRQETLEK